jgi:F-type H+-transporting ATPase subunit beta
MSDTLQLNVPLLRRRVPNLSAAARSVGIRPATVSDLCTGKIPIGRAEVKTLVGLAALAGCSVDELILRAGRTGLLETGIKAIDLLAPLVRGGVAGLIARPSVGQLVLVAELLRTLRIQRGFATLLWLPDQETPRPPDDVVVEAGASVTDSDELYSRIAELRSEQDVFVVGERRRAMTGDLLQLRSRLESESGARPVTFALYDADGDAADTEGAPFGPLETVWHLDLDLSTRHLYPAIDPVASTSTLLESGQVEATHLGLAQRARRLLRRYREWRPVVALRGLEHLPADEQTTFRRGERLEAFLTQPFFVAERFNKRSGAWLSLHETLTDVRHILDGSTDTLPVDRLTYIGRLVAGGSLTAETEE